MANYQEQIAARQREREQKEKEAQQLANFREVLVSQVGPLAGHFSDEEVRGIRDRLQQEINRAAMEADNG